VSKTQSSVGDRNLEDLFKQTDLSQFHADDRAKIVN
jgi:hypothetical protein